MAISTVLKVDSIAFAWGGNTRVLKCSKLRVWYDEDKQLFVAVDGASVVRIEGYFMRFSIDLSFFVQDSGTATSMREIINTINGGTAVNFYPIYSLDNSVNYAVIIPPMNDVTILETDDWGRFTKRRKLVLHASARISSLPTWYTD